MSSGSKLLEAEEFLRHILRKGPGLVTQVRETAGDLGISLPTLERARRDLRVRSDKARRKWGPWLWSLPEGDQGWGGQPEGEQG